MHPKQSVSHLASMALGLAGLSWGASAQGATWAYVFDAPSYTISGSGSTATVTVRLQETLGTGESTSTLKSVGLAGAGLRLNWTPSGAIGITDWTSNIISAGGLILMTADSSGTTASASLAAFPTNVKATGAGTVYSLPIASFTFTLLDNGLTTLSLQRLDPQGNMTGTGSVDLDPVISFAATATVTSSVPEPTTLCFLGVAAGLGLRRQRAGQSEPTE